MQIRLDRDVNALYIALRPGRVSKTVELTDTVYVDMDDQDTPIGIEFVNADEFVPFLRDHADDTAIPPQIRELFSVTAA
jgi:uncharacterized protein YuzE